jgi:hypothetical protein
MGIELNQVPRGFEPAEWLVGRLRALGRRRRALARIRGTFWFLAIAPAGVIVVAWLDLLAALSPGLRVAGMAAALSLAAAFVVRGALQARRKARPEAVARDVDRLAGSEGQVAVGLDLTQPPPGWSALTLGLARMAVRRALDIAAGVPEERIEALGTAGRALKCLMGVAAATVVLACLWPRASQTEFLRLVDPWGDHPPYSRYAFGIEPGDAKLAYGGSVTVTAKVEGPPLQDLDLVVRQPGGAESAMPMFEQRDRSWRAQLTDVTSPLEYWVRTGRAQSRRFSVSVIYTPRIDELIVRTTPPAYTNRPATEGSLPQGGVAGLPGTTVEITAKSNRPLSRGELRIIAEGGDPHVLVAEPSAGAPKAVTWRFDVEKAGTLSLCVVDVGGERSADVSAPILVLEDKRPFVRIVEPMAESFATPDVLLPVRLEADDDYGISSLRLYRSLNGSRHLPEGLIVPIPAAARTEAGDVLSLPQYSLSPGDVVTLFARAEDTDPAGPKGSESALVRITIISREVYEEMVRAQQTMADFEAKYEAAARRLESLLAEAERLSEAAAKEAGESVSEQMREQLKSFAEQLSQAAEETKAAADQQPLYALDADLAGPLRDLAEEFKGAAAEANGAARTPSPEEMRKTLDKARAALGRGQQGYKESVQQPLDRFMRAYSLLEMQERFVALAQRQRELADRMSDLKGRDGEDSPALRVRMRDLLEEEEAARTELAAVLDGIRAGAAELPEDPELEALRRTATEFCDAVEASRASPAMQESARGLAEDRGTTAHARAAEAADVLESFIVKCRAGEGAAREQCRLAFQPSMQENAAMTASQLLRAANLGAGQDDGPGVGAGRGGSSMRANTLSNVGVYGPATMAKGGGGGREARTPAFASGEMGGSMAGGIGGSRPGSPGYDGVPLQSVPPQHRKGVQDYFRRVAEEASTGAIIEPVTRGGDRGSRSSEEGQ